LAVVAACCKFGASSSLSSSSSSSSSIIIVIVKILCGAVEAEQKIEILEAIAALNTTSTGTLSHFLVLFYRIDDWGFFPRYFARILFSTYRIDDTFFCSRIGFRSLHIQHSFAQKIALCPMSFCCRLPSVTF
jgi:hypothetical protein